MGLDSGLRLFCFEELFELLLLVAHGSERDGGGYERDAHTWDAASSLGAVRASDMVV